MESASIRSHGAIANVVIPSAEKRSEGGKHYVYEIVVTFEDGFQVRVWRRYSQFDALRNTLHNQLKDGTTLPRLTRKLYLKRSAVHDVAIHRQPKLKRFLDQALEIDNVMVAAIVLYFVTPTANDEKRAKLDEPDSIIRFGGQHIHRRKRSKRAIAGEEDPFKTTVVRATSDAIIQSDQDLEFKEGDVLQVIGRFTDGFLECSFDGKTGIVNPELVEELDGDDAAMQQQLLQQQEEEARNAPKSVLEELIATEHAYVESLVEVRDNFFPKLRALVSAPEAKRFFNNWAELIPLHESFACELNISTDLDRTLATNLRQMAPAYSRYCSGIPAAQELYDQKIQEKDFAKFEASFISMNKPTLNHFMRPFQRVLKYPLLIRELEKEGISVVAANEASADLATTANENMQNPQQALAKADIAHTTAVVDNLIYEAIESVPAQRPAQQPAPTSPRPPAPPPVLRRPKLPLPEQPSLYSIRNSVCLERQTPRPPQPLPLHAQKQKPLPPAFSPPPRQLSSNHTTPRGTALQPPSLSRTDNSSSTAETAPTDSPSVMPSRSCKPRAPPPPMRPPHLQGVTSVNADANADVEEAAVSPEGTQPPPSFLEVKSRLTPVEKPQSVAPHIPKYAAKPSSASHAHGESDQSGTDSRPKRVALKPPVPSGITKPSFSMPPSDQPPIRPMQKPSPPPVPASKPPTSPSSAPSLPTLAEANDAPAARVALKPPISTTPSQKQQPQPSSSPSPRPPPPAHKPSISKPSLSRTSPPPPPVSRKPTLSSKADSPATTAPTDAALSKKPPKPKKPAHLSNSNNSGSSPAPS